MQEYAGLPRRKRSANKATWPGRKQVWRRYGADGRMVGDLLAAEAPTPPSPARGGGHGGGGALLQPVMQNGNASPPHRRAMTSAPRERELEDSGALMRSTRP